MPPLASPYKAAAGSRQRSASPLPPPPPAKPIDLNSSTRSTDKESGAKVTKRAFLCDVVIEREGEETANLLNYLGRPLLPLSTLPASPSSVSRPTTPSRLSHASGSSEDSDDASSLIWTRQKQVEMSTRLASLLEELVRTERSYVSRIQALKKSYADPLRSFARQDYSKIIPMYEAKTLFTNIDAILPAALAFLNDLEAMFAAGTGENVVGDICLKHLKILRTFDPYRTYISKQDESQKMFQDVLKKFSSFGSYIDRTKYQTTGIGNIGLRELLMEPVQRIPRYTLLWQTMIKCMSPLSTQRIKLVEAVEIASRIAKCEPDAQTVRATVLYCLERNVDGFPANLFSNNRDFIDSIDVEDLPAEYPTTYSPDSRRSHSSRPMSVTSASTSTSVPSLASFGSSASSSQLPTSPQSTMGTGAIPTMSSLHCSLFLFDDKLMIVKRQSSSISGRKTTGLDDVQKLVKSGGGVAVMDKNGAKKDKLSYRGIVDVLDVIASDVGNGDFHLFFEKPPVDQGDRWSGRPFRSYSTVQPPFGTSMDPVSNKKDKLRFIQNLWAAQAQARAKISVKEIRLREPPRVMISDEDVGLERAGEMFGRARCYWNVWQKDEWSLAPHKAKVVIHIDEDDSSPELPMTEGNPCMIIRLQPMSGSLCRFSYVTAANDGEARILIGLNEVQDNIVTTIHRYGIFKFRTATNSCPTTPSSTGHRLRPSMLNLDMISRNLFGHGSVSSRGQSADMFGPMTTKRRSNISRTSTIDTGRFSTSTTSSEERLRLSRQSSSPTGPISEDEVDVRLVARPYLEGDRHMGQSEIDLNERLNLARKNSKTMAAMMPPNTRLAAKSVAELRSRAEEKEVNVSRENSRLSAKSVGDLRQLKSGEDVDAMCVPQESLPPMDPTAPLRIRNKSPSPTRILGSNDRTPKAWSAENAVDQARPSIGAVIAEHTTFSLDSTVFRDRTLPPTEAKGHADLIVTSPRQLPSPPPQATSAAVNVPLSPRPQGPRSPIARTTPNVSGFGSTHTKIRIVSGNSRRSSASREAIRPTLDEDEPAADTPQNVLSKRQHSGDQMSPRKRSPTRSPLHSKFGDTESRVPDPLRIPSGGKKTGIRRVSDRTAARRSSGPLTTVRRVSAGTASVASQATSTAIDDVFMTDRTDALSATIAAKRKISESKANVKRLQAEIQTLKKHITKDSVKASNVYINSLPRSPHRRNINRLVDNKASIYDDGPLTPRAAYNGKHELDTMLLEESVRGLAAITEKLDGSLRAAQADSDQAELLAGRLIKDCAEFSEDIHRLQAQIERAKETQDLLREQLADTQVEVDVIYEAFNTELDGMFNDAQLPETAAFDALRRDLQQTKAQRNDLALENMKLKRELQEANLKREQWAKILRERGVLST